VKSRSGVELALFKWRIPWGKAGEKKRVWSNAVDENRQRNKGDAKELSRGEK
jgi:hypothetical protein